MVVHGVGVGDDMVLVHDGGGGFDGGKCDFPY